MPNTAQGETQNIRLSKVPVSAVRQAKSKAALLGETLEEFLTNLLTELLSAETEDDEK
jgi:hypothetical protein